MKAYLVLDLAIHDFESFREYIEKVPSFINKHGGKYIVQGAEPTPMEGDWRPERMVILEFPARQNGFLDRSRISGATRDPASNHNQQPGAG